MVLVACDISNLSAMVAFNGGIQYTGTNHGPNSVTLEQRMNGILGESHLKNGNFLW